MPAYTLTAGESPARLVEAAIVAFLHVLAFAGYGRLAGRRFLRGMAEDAVLVVGPALGVGVMTALMLIAGQAHLLYPGVVGALLVVGAALGVTWPPLRAAARRSPELLRRAWRLHPLWTGLIGLAVAALLVSAAAPPTATDELAYHWAAPVLWAHHHVWTRFPHGFVNGEALAEVNYTVEAVFGVSTGAHLLHLWFAGLLCAALAVIARRRGVPRMWGILVVFASPVVLLEASIAYSDVMFAALLAAALCALVTIENRSRFWVTGLLLGLAASVKVAALIAAPGLLAVAATWGRDAGWGWVPHPGQRVRGAVVIVAQLTLPLVALGAVWAVHSQLTVHQLFPSGGYFLATVQQNPLAPGRIPSVLDVVEMPVLWITVTLFGNSQPYGNRIGILVALALPVAALLWRRTPAESRRGAVTLVLPALLYLAFDVVIARTRFNIYAWLLLALGALVPIAERAARSARFARWAGVGLTLCVLESLADALRRIPFPHL